MTDEELVVNEKNLAVVERAFRSIKLIDLNVRRLRSNIILRIGYGGIFGLMDAYFEAVLGFQCDCPGMWASPR